MKNYEKYKTVEERKDAYLKFCGDCRKCKFFASCKDEIDCAMAWLMDEAEEEKPEPLPCPFCGGEPRVRALEDGQHFVVECLNKNCAVKFMSNGCKSMSEAIAAWNRRAK